MKTTIEDNTKRRRVSIDVKKPKGYKKAKIDKDRIKPNEYAGTIVNGYLYAGKTCNVGDTFLIQYYNNPTDSYGLYIMTGFNIVGAITDYGHIVEEVKDTLGMANGKIIDVDQSYLKIELL